LLVLFAFLTISGVATLDKFRKINRADFSDTDEVRYHGLRVPFMVMNAIIICVAGVLIVAPVVDSNPRYLVNEMVSASVLCILCMWLVIDITYHKHNEKNEFQLLLVSYGGLSMLLVLVFFVDGNMLLFIALLGAVGSGSGKEQEIGAFFVDLLYSGSRAPVTLSLLLASCDTNGAGDLVHQQRAHRGIFFRVPGRQEKKIHDCRPDRVPRGHFGSALPPEPGVRQSRDDKERANDDIVDRGHIHQCSLLRVLARHAREAGVRLQEEAQAASLVRVVLAHARVLGSAVS
jgi:hypothetical protein